MCVRIHYTTTCNGTFDPTDHNLAACGWPKVKSPCVSVFVYVGVYLICKQFLIFSLSKLLSPYLWPCFNELVVFYFLALYPALAAPVWSYPPSQSNGNVAGPCSTDQWQYKR